MASKRARSSGAVRPTFGRVDLGDGDAQAPGRQSRRDGADPAAQAAALAYRVPVELAVCRFCSGEHEQTGERRLIHDRACPLR